MTWSAKCVIVSDDVANQNATFTITETKLYDPAVSLSTQDNAKLDSVFLKEQLIGTNIY